ncbi:unnamed protein product [Cylicostephanus goldi]|uniref:Uncharacterized protein n=1 Tax=Cylicostephanus goldi TaxID=71465 RepID=A0A3P6S3R9_CYLGO|nr:unnamed protein product [Cylicostephanus goldi]
MITINDARGFIIILHIIWLSERLSCTAAISSWTIGSQTMSTYDDDGVFEDDAPTEQIFAGKDKYPQGSDISSPKPFIVYETLVPFFIASANPSYVFCCECPWPLFLAAGGGYLMVENPRGDLHVMYLSENVNSSDLQKVFIISMLAADVHRKCWVCGGSTKDTVAFQFGANARCDSGPRQRAS